MYFKPVLIIVSVGIFLNVSAAGKIKDNMEQRLKLLDVKKFTYKVPSIEQRHELLRKMRSTSSINAQNLDGNEIDLKDIDIMLPNTVDFDHQHSIKKRHACRSRHNRRNNFRLDNENNNNYEQAKSKDSSEESKEINTEDPFYSESAENFSTKQEEKTTAKPQKASNEKIDLKDIDIVVPNTVDFDHQHSIKKRHACRSRHNRRNNFLLDNENNNNYEQAKSKDSSEENKEINTEDPFYSESAENFSTKQEEKTTKKPQKASNEKIDLKDIDIVVPNTIDFVHQHSIKKRHACRSRHNRRNDFRLDNENNNNNEQAKSKDSSEESKEINTEDPFYSESVESVSTKQEEKTTRKPQRASNEKQRKNNSKQEKRNRDNESRNVKRNENNEAENEKRKESGESADKEEFIFSNIPREISANNENKNRKDNNYRRNQRIERDVIEEENVATTAPGYRFTSGYADLGSKVSFRNINI